MKMKAFDIISVESEMRVCSALRQHDRRRGPFQKWAELLCVTKILSLNSTQLSSSWETTHSRKRAGERLLDGAQIDGVSSHAVR